MEEAAWIKYVLTTLWAAMVCIAGWTAFRYWGVDQRAAWTSIALMVVLVAAFMFMRKVWSK